FVKCVGGDDVPPVLWHLLPPLPLAPTEGLHGPIDSPTGSGRPSVEGHGTVRRPCHNGEGRRVGGIDFGFRNPFAAVWGFVDRDGVLHITDEIYRRETTLDVLSGMLPRGVLWYADPAGAGDIASLRRADHRVLKGRNDLRLGIQAVTAWIRTGRLKVDGKRCPNLVREARLYRYDEDGSETPVDEENHALAALRYVIARLDERRPAHSRQLSDTTTQ